MFPNAKKNLFQDKVETAKKGLSGVKRTLLALVVGSVVSYASTTLPANGDSIVNSKQSNMESTFVLEPKTSPMEFASHHSHRSHHSHYSHRSHHSHYSSRA